MKLTEELRSDLYVTLTELVGSNGAEFLMTQGPPELGAVPHPDRSPSLAVDLVAGFAAADAKHVNAACRWAVVAAATQNTKRATEMVAGFAAADAKTDALRPT